MVGINVYDADDGSEYTFKTITEDTLSTLAHKRTVTGNKIPASIGTTTSSDKAKKNVAATTTAVMTKNKDPVINMDGVESTQVIILTSRQWSAAQLIASPLSVQEIWVQIQAGAKPGVNSTKMF